SRPAEASAARILAGVWVFPLLATIVAFVFAGMLAKRFAIRRGQPELLWAVAVVMFGLASLALTAGVFSGWARTWFGGYCAVGAVLTVALLAGGELVLLFRRTWVLWAVWLVLVFLTAFTLTILRGAAVDPLALTEQLPLGSKVFGAASSARRLSEVIAYPAWGILVLRTVWSARKRRGRPEPKERVV